LNPGTELEKKHVEPRRKKDNTKGGASMDKKRQVLTDS